MKKRWAETETKTTSLPLLAQDTAPIRRQARRHPHERGLPIQVLVESTSSSPWQCGNVPTLFLGSRNVVPLWDSRELLARCRADACERHLASLLLLLSLARHKLRASLDSSCFATP